MAVDGASPRSCAGPPYVDEVIEADEGRSRLAAWTEPWRHLAGCRVIRASISRSISRARAGAPCGPTRASRGSGRGSSPARAGAPGGPGGDTRCARDPTRHAVRGLRGCRRGGRGPCRGPESARRDLPRGGSALRGQARRDGSPRAGFILVNPFTRWPSKNWPTERYRELVERLAASQSAPILVHAGPGEEAGLKRSDQGAGATGRGRGRPAARGSPRALRPRPPDGDGRHRAHALRRRAGRPRGRAVRADLAGAHRSVGSRPPDCPGSAPPAPHAYRTDGEGRYIRAIDVTTVHRAVLEALAALEDVRPISVPRSPRARSASM